MELTITTDRKRQWSRTLYVVDEETFARIFQILKENDLPATQRRLTTHETDTVHTCPYCHSDGVRLSNIDGKYYDCIHCKGTGQV